MATSPPKFTVAIAGGGIGGVFTALALSKHPDIQFDLYEAASGFHEVGLAVGLFGRSLTAIKRLGLVEDLEKIVTPAALHEHALEYRKSNISPKGVMFARRFQPAPLPGSGTYYRPRLLETIASLLPEGVRESRIHFNKRLSHYVQTANGVTLHFNDGTTAVADILVGADGIRSPTRCSMFEELAAAETDEGQKKGLRDYATPLWSGSVAFRGLVSFDEVEAVLGEPHRLRNSRNFYMGKAAHIFALPVATEGKINVVAFATQPVIPEHEGLSPTELVARGWPADKPWVEESSPEAMLKAFAGFEDEALALLKCMKRPSRWVIHQLDPLPTYVNGHVALVGDAAHATTPHQGQGANQSIESAYVLAQILGSEHTTRDNIALALKAYDHVRRPRANEVIDLSEKSGRLHQFLVEDDLPKLKELFEGPWLKWLFTGDCGDDVKAALDWMQDQS